ncbi:hypothetical protein B0H19DRAFT_1190702 [Mycena capillaripes]|nr:hypothetical protein B0H19DRAFT_1190702 [Mycena capillaripes]
MPENFRERADLTKIIKSILDSYPLGNGILRELLQNSDDALATQQTFILDLRTHPSMTVVDPDLVPCQGPALLAVNDTLFSDSDWKAISTLHSSSKTTDETKVGKFGIGVRACYHITDNPHFLSGGKLVIFDPHERFSAGHQGGVRIDLLEEGEKYSDQLAAFHKSLNPNDAGIFPGTVVRLPLRTVGQAAKSTIKPTVVDPSVIEMLFKDFVEKELSVVMLFLKHIRFICLKIISPGGQERFIGSAEIPDLSIAEKRTFARNTGAREETFRCAINVTSSNGMIVQQVWRICHAVRSTAETSKIIKDQLGYDIGSKLANDKLFSHVALAFPTSPSVSNFNGRLFTVLPLPIHTNFPVHMHAILALTQDRQSLRNIEETGTGPDSRERLLVTWNRTIFDEFLPATWSALLRILVAENETEDIWSAWPSSDHAITNGSAYWSRILPNLMQRVVDLDLPVFPTFPNAEKHVSLSTALIASETDDIAVLRALANVGLAVVKFPLHLRNALPANSVGLLHPSRVHVALMSRISKLTAASEEDKDHILRYLVLAPGTVTLAIGLPLVPLVDGTRTSLLPFQKYVLVKRQEGEIFGNSNCNGDLISLFNMPPGVAAVFCAANLVNVARLNKMHVRDYLNIVFGVFNPAIDEVSGDNASSKVDWLTRFWKWMFESTWEDKRALLLLVNGFHLLPTAHGTLRKMESRIILPIPGPNGANIMAAWGVLGVGFLHPNIVPYASAFSDLTVAANDITFLISLISSQAIPCLGSTPALLIQDHLVQSLVSRGSPLRLDARNQQKFLQLPIFPIRVAIPDPKGGKKFSRREVGPACGTLIYMRVDESCPVPMTRDDTTFFDVAQKSSVLGTIINPAGMRKALDELGVLEMAIDQLVVQPASILDALLTRIIHRLSDLSPSATSKLHHVPFVPVIGSTQRIPPSQVIDPRSELASLYEGEAGKLPSGHWGNEPYLSLLTSHGFFKKQLTADIVTERITYLTKRWPEKEYPRIFTKAQIFLGLLDKSWPSIQAIPGVANSLEVTKPWMPIRKDLALAAPVNCRDKGDLPYLFDLVFSIVNGRILNQGLRRSLGWDGIPTHVLRNQLQSALTHTENRPIRLLKLITEFSRRSPTLSSEEIDTLKRTVSDQPWVPIREQPPVIVETRHALLRLESTLRGRFRTVPRSLLEAHSGHGTMFLQKMGCTESPCLETLLTELDVVVGHANRNGEVLKEVMEILKEIAPLLPGRFQSDYERIFVPGKDGIFHPIVEVYFVDSASEFLPETGFPVHPAVSESLARDLEVQFLSALELGEDDGDEDDLQMGEDFTKRVEGVLKEHDVEHALNEFLANSIDANANRFSVLLDERTFECSKVLAPALSDLQRRPSLLLYNDSTFSDDDFRGLRQVGQGGKRSNPDSIGRYGLGALSLFHFTDVVQIVSDQFFLILDPSGKHLPPVKGIPRTSLLKRISDVARRYPDQLSAFDSIHGFSKSDTSYSGTLFRLPLRDKPSPLSSKVLKMSDCLNLLQGPYFSLAKDAMYFTSLERISAVQQPPMGPSTHLWSVLAERPPKEKHLDHEIVYVKASSRDSPAYSQLWLVTKSTTPVSSVPYDYNSSVLVGMGLHESKVGLVVRMALLLEESTSTAHFKAHPAPDPKTHFLFSTLRLPVPTSVSAHISAPFAISSDRRHIRFEPPDTSGHRIPQAAFNNWILDTLIPPLYMSTIHYAAIARNPRVPRNPFRLGWWPVDNNNSDPISRILVQAFYELVPKSALPICFTVTAELIAPTDAMFSGVRTPFRVEEVLRKIQTPNFVELPYKVHALVVKASSAAGGVEQLCFVDPSFVRNVLETRTNQLAILFNKHDYDGISVPTIDAVLSFLLKGGAAVSDLPLLITAEGALTHGNSRQPTKYVCKGNIPNIFSRGHFLHEEMDQETKDLLIQSSNINVKLFDAIGVLALLKEQVPPEPRCNHSAEVQRWIDRFWEMYTHLPGPPSPASLDPFPLISTASGEYISLEYCRRDDVITEPVERPALVSAMQKMSLVFCRVPAPLRASFDKPFNLQSYLKAIRSKSYPFDSLSPDETREIGSWIRSNVWACTDSDSRSVVKDLPIWEARQNGRAVLIEAGRLEMLPDHNGLSAEIFDGYARSETAIANFSHELQTVLSWSQRFRSPAMTSEQLARLLIFPDVLDTSNRTSYSTLLTALLNLGGMGAIPVPDGNLRLRLVSELYDHSVDLFAAALQSVARSLFLHLDFRYMHQSLRAKGLNFVVYWESFLLCAKTVHDDLTTRYLPESDIMSRAGVVYDFYNSSLPGIIMTNANRWRELDGLRFITRREHRSPSSSYATDSYCEHLPRIVAPRQILQQKYEKIAWTQRLLCKVEPTPGLVALNGTLGVPTAAEVVRHLGILALQVAPQHPGNRTLLEQIRETYKWLNENSVEARIHLLSTPDDALFLNVDDPSSLPWEWRTAAQLLFDIEYDYPETKTFRVHKFLQGYRSLLLAAGAGIEAAVDFRPKTKAQDGNTLRDMFNAMRKAGKLTDVVLMPSETRPDEVIDAETLRAHSSFLAAAIPHVQDGLSDWAEANSKSYSFPGTYFGARAVLEFIYTGKIEPNPGETDDGHMTLLRDLLELLGDADEWDMPELKDEIGRLVKDWKFLSRDTYWMILDEAAKYTATSLQEYCQEWGRLNPKSVLVRFEW